MITASHQAMIMKENKMMNKKDYNDQKKNLIGNMPEGESNSKKNIENVMKNDKPYLTLNNNCMGCSGGSAVTMNAFKMACLSYNPTNVN